MRSDASHRDPGLAGGKGQNNRSGRKRSRQLQIVCTCTTFSTGPWHSGRTTVLRSETGETECCWGDLLLTVLSDPRFVCLFACQEEPWAAGLPSGRPALHEMVSGKMEKGDRCVCCPALWGISAELKFRVEKIRKLVKPCKLLDVSLQLVWCTKATYAPYLKPHHRHFSWYILHLYFLQYYYNLQIIISVYSEIVLSSFVCMHVQTKNEKSKEEEKHQIFTIFWEAVNIF